MVSRKGPSKGTGGHGRKRLEGRGPTPKAEDRSGHPAARRSRRASQAGAAAARQPRGSRGAPSRPTGPSRRRTVAGDEVVAGRNAVLEALRASVPATTLYVATGLERDQRITDALKLATSLSLPLLEASRPELDRLSGGAPHQGIALQVKAYEYADLDDLLRREAEAADPPLLIALDGVTDPHNLGAIVRSAAAFGGHGVVLPERRSVGVTAAAWKASAGALARLPVARVTNLSRAIATCIDAGLSVAGLDGDGELCLDDFELGRDPLLLVVGSEGRGLSRLVAERCDVRVRIDLAGGVESLNASVAAGVALAAVSRSRRRGG